MALRALSAQVRRAAPQRNRENAERGDKVSRDLEDSVDSERQLMSGYREYLDGMLEHTKKLDRSLKELQESYAKLPMDPVDPIFQEAAHHKETLKLTVAELKTMMEQAHRTFAVDAPDGEPDCYVQDEFQQVSDIIDHASLYEDATEITEARKIFAVDGPDGDPDGHYQEELKEVQHMIASTLSQDAAEIYESRKFAAVDAPDGDPDGRYQEELDGVKQMFEDTPKGLTLEKDVTVERNVEKIFVMDGNGHMKNEVEGSILEDAVAARKVFAVDAPDGDSDGHWQEELDQVHHTMIDDMHEDANKIQYQHKMNEGIRMERARDPEHDW